MTPEPPAAEPDLRRGLSSADLAALKAEAHDLDAVLHVGKSGITDAFVDELAKRLKRDRLVKIRLLKSSREESDRHALASELATRARAALVETRGNTVVLYKPKGKRKAAAE